MSTRTALTVVGAVVGAYFGYPQLGMVIGSLVGSAVDPEKIQGPRIGEVNAQTSIEGAPRTIVYGTIACYGNVIQSGQVIKREVEEEGGGKGGAEVSSEHAFLTFAVRICEGPISGVLRIWQDNKLVYDKRPGSQMLAESDQWAANKVFYMGDEDQLPDPTLVATVNPDTPAYRGSAYMVAVLDDITARKSISQFRYEVAGSITSSLILGPLVVNQWSGANPVHYQGETLYTVQPGETYTDFSTAAVAAAALAAVAVPAAASSSTFVSYTTNLNFVQSIFTPDGANLTPDPQTITYSLGARAPDVIENPDVPDGFYLYCSPLQLLGAVPDDNKLFAIRLNDDSMILASLWSTLPSSGPYSVLGNYCINYPPDGPGGSYPAAGLNPIVHISGQRVPSPPLGWTRVDGEAKQLCAVEYRSGALYQNALGPLLLPDDPNYDNTAFWADAKDAAIIAGLMHDDVSSPVEVDAYAYGTSTVGGLPVPLGLIVADIHNRCGSDEGSYDVSELVDLVAGFGLAGDYTGASAIDALRPIYHFDKSLHDLKFWYPKRGAPVIETLTIDDLTEVPDTTKREQALDVPYKLHLRYQHAASGYAPVKATSPRTPSPDFLTSGEAVFEIPVVLNEDQAAQCSDVMYKVILSEQAGTTEIYVPLNVGAKYADANVIGLFLRGRVDRYRIEQQEFSDWKLKLILRPDRQSAYTSTLTGVPIPEPTLPPSTIVGETELAVLDISARVDSEDDLNYLVAVSGSLPPWYGARYQRSLDDGANYTTVLDITQASIMGTILEDVASAAEGFTDTTNTVTVQLYRSSQTIDSITEEQFLSEQGAFVLEKADGSWEIMQYMNADQDSSGNYVLSTLHRGLLNSGPSSHTAGSKFVMLQRPSHIPAQSSWIGSDLTHRAISLGSTADDTENEFTKEFVGRSQIEWPVAYLELTRDGDDVSATWTPRHRFGTDDSPVASINFQGYRVTATDGVTTQTIDTLTPSYEGTWAAEVDISVSSLNRITGAGPVTTESI